MTNSAHFASVTRSEKIQDHEIMVSFDLESLFTNVANEGAVQAAPRKLESDPTLADRTTLPPAQIADVLESTYFQFNGSIYAQRNGQQWGARFPQLLLISTWRSWKKKQWNPCLANLRSGSATWTIPSPSWTETELTAFYNTSTVSNRPSASAWKPRLTARLPSSTH